MFFEMNRRLRERRCDFGGWRAALDYSHIIKIIVNQSEREKKHSKKYRKPGGTGFSEKLLMISIMIPARQNI